MSAADLEAAVAELGLEDEDVGVATPTTVADQSKVGAAPH